MNSRLLQMYGPESQIDPGLGDLGGLRHAMLPEGLGCALHDKETAVLELDRDRRAHRADRIERALPKHGREALFSWLK
jgi:hypothetical protein